MSRSTSRPMPHSNRCRVTTQTHPSHHIPTKIYEAELGTTWTWMEGLEIDATAGSGCIMHAACMHGTPLEIASACALIRSAAATSAACFAKRASSLTEPKRFWASSRCRAALSSDVAACPSAMAARPWTNCPNTHSLASLEIYTPCVERWGAGVETQKNVRGEIGGWGRVPFNEPYAPSLSTIYDGASGSLNSWKWYSTPAPHLSLCLSTQPSIRSD